MLYGFTEDQVKRIENVVRIVETLLPTPDVRPPAENLPSLWTYIAQATEEIPALSGDDPGKGSAKIHNLNLDDESLDEKNLDDINIFNLSLEKIPDDSYLAVIRDPYSGRFFVPYFGSCAFLCMATSAEAVAEEDASFSISSPYILQPNTAEWPGGSAPTIFYNTFSGAIDNAVSVLGLYDWPNDKWHAIQAPCPA